MVQLAQKKRYRKLAIDEEIYNLLDKFARELGQTKKGLAQDAIVAYMTVMKDARERETDNDKR